MSSSRISVKLNAPNWPAMVAVKEKKEVRETKQQYTMTSAASSLWLHAHFNKENESKASLRVVEPSKFASKTSIVRQCSECQVLYTSFHKCGNGKCGEELMVSKRKCSS